MKLNFFNIACFIFLISTSCNKEPGPFSVSGAVIDYTTNQPIADATVYLLAHEKDGDFWSSSPSFIIDTTISDAHGKFSFSPEKNDAWGYSCMAEKELYFDGQEFTADGNYALTVTAYLYPQAWLKIHVKNEIPYNESDKIAINGAITISFIGTEIDTTNVYTVSGNDDNYIYWSITKNLITTVFGDTIYIAAFDTTFYEILY